MYLCYTLHEATSVDYIDLQTQIYINIYTTLYSYALPFVFFLAIGPMAQSKIFSGYCSTCIFIWKTHMMLISDSVLVLCVC